jgi:hypothetical protein
MISITLQPLYPQEDFPYRDLNFYPSVVQLVASRYTDGAIAAPRKKEVKL